jgi:hypothetical protein
MRPVSTAVRDGSARATGEAWVEHLERVGVEAADESLEGGHVSMVREELDRSQEIRA